MVDIFTVHKFMKANCKAAQLHQDVKQVVQQLVASGQPLQNSSHANKKNKKQKITGEGKGTFNELLVLDALIMALHKAKKTGQTWNKVSYQYNIKANGNRKYGPRNDLVW